MADSNIRFKISQEGADKVKNSFNKIGTTIAGFVVGGALIELAKQSVLIAAKAEGVEAAFKRLNRPNLLSNLKEATRGTVNELQLMMTTMRAANFKIPLDQLATLLEFATKRASQTGESVDYLVNSIVDGIGRKSTLVLDNLGISATELQKEVKKVGDFGEATGNIVSRELGKMGDVAETTSDTIAQLTAMVEDFKASIGKDIIRALRFWAREIEATTRHLNAMADFFDRLFGGIGGDSSGGGLGRGMRDLISIRGRSGGEPEIIADLIKVKNLIKEITGGEAGNLEKFGSAFLRGGLAGGEKGLAGRGGTTTFGEAVFRPGRGTANQAMLKDANKIGQTIFDGWANILTSNMNTAWATIFGEANSMFEQLINSMADLLIKNVFSQLLSFIPGGGILGFVGDLFSSGASPAGSPATNITIEMGGMPLGQIVLEGNRQISQRRLV